MPDDYKLTSGDIDGLNAVAIQFCLRHTGVRIQWPTFAVCSERPVPANLRSFDCVVNSCLAQLISALDLDCDSIEKGKLKHDIAKEST